MKTYESIDKVRENDIVVNRKTVIPANISSFHENDIVSVTELVDGVHIQIQYNSIMDMLDCFSDDKRICKDNPVHGAYDFVRKLTLEPFKRYPNYEFFGEWMIPNKLKYDYDNCAQWYLFSVFNHDTGKWMPQSFVKGFATKYQFNYVHELYFGPFLGWDHVYNMSNSPHYGPYMKGLVVKNQTALEENRLPLALKYVNTKRKPIIVTDSKSPEHRQAKDFAKYYAEKVVTYQIIIDAINQLKFDGQLPQCVTKQDMCAASRILSKVLPSCVYSCLGEDVKFETSGQLIAIYVKRKCMKVAKEILLSQQ